MGGIVEGATQLYTSVEENNATHAANQLQYSRTVQQANTAIEGARAKASYEMGKQRIMGAMVAGKQRTAYANSGVDATSGTAAAVQADTQALNELDVQTMAITAAREVWGYKEAKRQAGENLQMEGANADRKAIGGALGGLTKYGEGWAKLGGGG